MHQNALYIKKWKQKIKIKMTYDYMDELKFSDDQPWLLQIKEWQSRDEKRWNEGMKRRREINDKTTNT